MTYTVIDGKVLRDAILSCLKRKLMSATWRDFESLNYYTRTSLLYIGTADVYADDSHRYIDKLSKIRHMLWSNYECTCIDIAHWRHMWTAFQRISSHI